MIEEKCPNRIEFVEHPDGTKDLLVFKEGLLVETFTNFQFEEVPEAFKIRAKEAATLGQND